MKIYLIGVGMGSKECISVEALNKIEKSDIIIGSERVLNSFENFCNGKLVKEVNSYKIADVINNAKETSIVSVLFSGDSGFYSGCKKLSDILDKEVTIIPGISAVSYFSSRINRSWEGVKLVSAHGKKINPTAHITSNREVFFLTGGDINAETIINDVYENRLNECYFYIGENLSYENETITQGFAYDIYGKKFSNLSVVWCVNYGYNENMFAFDIDDNEFIKENVPITKREVRNAVVRELKLKKEGVFFDIGGGTGSVSVAVSKVSPFLDIFTIEKNCKACGVIKKNFEKHNVYNSRIVTGLAPIALEGLPAPDYVFIGGSSGCMKEIVPLVMKMNSKVRIVITALTLESLCQIQELLNENDIKKWRGFQISVNDIKSLGNLHGFISQNSVFIFSFGGDYEL